MKKITILLISIFMLTACGNAYRTIASNEAMSLIDNGAVQLMNITKDILLTLSTFLLIISMKLLMKKTQKLLFTVLAVFVVPMLLKH